MKGKEVKIGLSIIGLLLCVFGTVLFVRLRNPDPDAAIAAKNAAKHTPESSQPDAKGEDQDAESSKGTPSDELSSKSGPALGFKSAGARYSSRASEQEPEKFAVRDAWPNSTKSAPSAGRYPSGATSPGQEPSGGGRYGRPGETAEDLQFGSTEHQNPSDADAAAADDEMPAAASDSAENGLLAPANVQAGDEPADGYRVGDEPLREEFPSQAAANDPFPSAATPNAATRGLPIAGGGRLEKTAGEMELPPADAADSAPAQDTAAADSSDAAVEAEVQAAARQMRRGYGYGNASSGARPGFSSVSRRSDAFAQPADNPSSDDAAGGVLPADRDTSGDPSLAEDRPGGEGVYFVEANDSFASISKKVYGTEGYFKALHEYNRERYPNPDLIDAGDEIATPEAAVLEQAYPKLCPKRRNLPAEAQEGAMRLASTANSGRRGRTYLVANGDTLFDIAKRELGKANRWREIYDLNQDVLGDDFNYLSPGTELRLPDGGERPDPVADRRSYDRRRR